MLDAPNKTAMELDGNGKSYPIVPAGAALKATYNATLSASTPITLDNETRLIEVSAGDEPIFIKYGDGNTASAATDGFDEFIGAGMTRHYPINQTQDVDFILNLFSTSTVAVLIEK